MFSKESINKSGSPSLNHSASSANGNYVQKSVAETKLGDLV